MIRRIALTVVGADRDARTPARWFVVLAVFVATLVLTLFRVPPGSWNILWAEDGAVFVTGAFGGDPWVFAQTYVGYLHIVPRALTALSVAVVGVQWVPLAMAILAALTVAATATAVFCFAKTRLTSTWVCVLLAVQVAILPIAGGEVALSVANLHWYLMVGAFWAAIVTPASRWLTVVQCVIVAAAVLSDPLGALLVFPLALARVIAVRPFSGRRHAVTWAFLGASVIQGLASVAATFLRDERNGSSFLPSFAEFSGAYSGRVVLNSFVGPTGTTALVESLGTVALVVAFVVAAAIVGTVAWRDPERRWLVVALAAASVCFSIVVFCLKWEGLVGVPYGALAPGGRYLVVPVLLLFSAYAVAADSFSQLLAPRRLALVPILALAAIVVIPGVVDYRIADVRAEAPSWQSALDTAADLCTANPDQPYAAVTIAPTWFGGAVIGCDVVVAARSH